MKTHSNIISILGITALLMIGVEARPYYLSWIQSIPQLYYNPHNFWSIFYRPIKFVIEIGPVGERPVTTTVNNPVFIPTTLPVDTLTTIAPPTLTQNVVETSSTPKENIFPDGSEASVVIPPQLKPNEITEPPVDNPHTSPSLAPLPLVPQPSTTQQLNFQPPITQSQIPQTYAPQPLIHQLPDFQPPNPQPHVPLPFTPHPQVPQ